MTAERPGWLLRASARLLRASTIVDRFYSRFDRMRTRAVLRSGGPRFYDAYNAVAYESDGTYRPADTAFRSSLFQWEESAFGERLPPPPARLLIGGCGGGREAFALAARGYNVVGFDPAPKLVGGIRTAARPSVEAFVGRYEALPLVRDSGSNQTVDLSRRSFDAAILGWGSFAHLLNDAARVDALRRMAALTTGPVIVSYLPAPERTTTPRPPTFSVRLGYYRELMGSEMRAFAESAGLDVVVLNDHDNWPHAVLRRRG